MDLNLEQLAELTSNLSEKNGQILKERLTVVVRELNHKVNKMKSLLKSELDRMDTIYQENCLSLPPELINCPVEEFDGELIVNETKYDSLGITIKNLLVKYNNEVVGKMPINIPRCISEPKLINDKKFAEMITKKPVRNATENEPINVLLVSNKGTPLIRNKAAPLSIDI